MLEFGKRKGPILDTESVHNGNLVKLYKAHPDVNREKIEQLYRAEYAALARGSRIQDHISLVAHKKTDRLLAERKKNPE